jgi:putative membrane protein
MTKTMSRIGYFLGAAALMAPLAVVAQMPPAPGPVQGQNPTNGQMASANPMDSSGNGSVTNDTQLIKDKMFVRRATDGGFAEVQFGQLAAQKAASDDVKKLGQKLVDDRTQLDANLKPVADDLGVRMPSKLAKADQEEFDKLKGLSGADFDKEYLTYSLKSHRDDLHAFHTEEGQTNDQELKDAVAKQEAVIVGHLYMVNKLALVNGVPGAYKGKAPAALPPPPPPAPQQ